MTTSNGMPKNNSSTNSSGATCRYEVRLGETFKGVRLLFVRVVFTLIKGGRIRGGDKISAP